MTLKCVSGGYTKKYFRIFEFEFFSMPTRSHSTHFVIIIPSPAEVLSRTGRITAAQTLKWR